MLTDQLFGFYGPAPQLAASLIDRIASLPDSQPYLDMLRSILHEHKEFEQCGKLIPQQQMRFEWSVFIISSVFTAMELALRHHLINVTEHTVFTVIAEATRPFDITESNDVLIKSMTPYDCTILHTFVKSSSIRSLYST